MIVARTSNQRQIFCTNGIELECHVAGDWTAIEHATIGKAEIGKLVAYTGRSKHEVFGLMVHFWIWAESVTSDGVIDMPLGAIPVHIGADAAFWEAVVRAGWLEIIDDDSFMVPRAENWLANGAKTRLLKNRRQSKWRDGGVDGGVDGQPSTNAPTTEQEQDSTSPVSGTGAKAGKPVGASGSNGPKPGSAFECITTESLKSLESLKEWQLMQSKRPRPLVSMAHESLELICAAALESLDHPNPPAKFASLMKTSETRAKIQDKYRIQGRKFAKGAA